MIATARLVQSDSGDLGGQRDDPAFLIAALEVWWAGAGEAN